MMRRTIIRNGLAAVIAAAMLTGCGNPEKCIEKGESLLESGEYEKAIEQFEKAVKLDPTEDDGYLDIISAAISHEDFGLARMYAEEAKENLSEIKYEKVEKEIEKYTMEQLDSIHRAILWALMDPEVVHAIGYDAEEEKYREAPVYIADLHPVDGPICAAMLQTLGVRDGIDVTSRIVVSGESNPEILVQFIGSHDVQVWIEGHDEYMVK